MSKVLKCTCFHDYQDKVYGNGMRVMNPTKNESEYRCTIYDKIQNKNSSKSASKIITKK